MRKSILLFVGFLMMLLSNLNAQDVGGGNYQIAIPKFIAGSSLSENDHRFHGGVRIGFNASQISGDDLAGFNKPGVMAGIFVNRAISQSGNIKLQLELDFSMKGSHSKASQRTQSFYVLNLGYVEVPILIEWNMCGWYKENKPNIEIFLEAGPVFGVNVYQKERDIFGEIIGRPQFRRFEFSAIAGLGALFAEHHSVSLRYSNSIIPVRIPNWAYNRLINKQFNSVLTISYAYQF